MLAFLFGAQPARGAPVSQIEACIAHQLPGDTPQQMIAATARFSCNPVQHKFGPGDYWISLKLPAPRHEMAAPVLLFTPNYQENAALFMHGPGGSVVETRLDPLAISRRTQVGAKVEVPITNEAFQNGVLLLRIDGALNSTGLLNAPQLLEVRAAHVVELREMAIYAAFFGLCLALLVYNFVFWLTMRERFQLVYCGSVAAMLAYAGLHSGVADMLFPSLGAALRLRLNYLALGCLAVLALRFVAAFLPARSIPRLLSRVLDAGCVAILVASLATTLAPADWFYLADRIYVLAFLPLPLLAVALCICGWRHDRDSVRVLVLAWSLPTVMAVVRILHSLNVVGFSSLVEHSVVIAMSFEALLSSLAMSLRIRHVLGERDLARAEEHAARRLSEIDPLTGLQNRRALLANAVNMAPGQPLRLLLVDIDFFKSINDTYGHGVGDEVLREVAAVLARSLEIRGTAARLGGEEFALLGPAAELPDDLGLAVLTDIRAADMPEGIRITVSIGSADGVVAHESDWRDLYRRADAALYDAKHSGRNCHVVGQKPRQPREPAVAA